MIFRGDYYINLFIFLKSPISFDNKFPLLIRVKWLLEVTEVILGNFSDDLNFLLLI